jgi:hypothetical protein
MHCISITKTNQSTLFREIATVYSENHMKLINNVLHGQSATFVILKQGGTYSNHCDLRVMSYIHIIFLELKVWNYLEQHTLFVPLRYHQEGLRITETFRLKFKLDTCVSNALNVRSLQDIFLIQIKTLPPTQVQPLGWQQHLKQEYQFHQIYLALP